jgi:uncharacterized protein YgfB (UPF0149 family)
MVNRPRGACYDRALTTAGTVPAEREAALDTEYERIAQHLAASELSPSPGEAHGILCGLICGGAADPQRAWLEQLLPGSAGAAAGSEYADAAAGLALLAGRTLGEIEGPGLGFAVLLPDDSQPLAERATALYDWVRGFLFALGVLGVSEQDLTDQTREIFRDFADLTRMDLDDLTDDSGNEDALTELTEFVWVAAMLVYEERVAAPKERPR